MFGSGIITRKERERSIEEKRMMPWRKRKRQSEKKAKN